MNNKGKKVVTSLAVLAGLASGAGALNMFVNRTVKSIIYRHHKEDDKPSILEKLLEWFLKNLMFFMIKLKNIYWKQFGSYVHLKDLLLQS